MRRMNYLGAAAALMLVAQPCLAAQDIHLQGAAERRSGGFAGVSLRVPLDRGARERPSARLQLTTMQSIREDGGQGAVRSQFAPGLELGAAGLGRPSLFVGGQELSTMQQRLGIGGSTTTLLVIGAVVLVVVVLAAVASALPTPGPREGDFD